MGEKFRLPFKSYSKEHTQSFDREKIVLTKCGKTFNVYDFIQSGREDTEIYPTLEKYGCIDRMIVDYPQVFADLTQAKDLRGLYDQDIALRNIFDSLPLEERRLFNHDFYTFKEQGLSYFEQKKKAIDKKYEDFLAKQKASGTNSGEGGSDNADKK